MVSALEEAVDALLCSWDLIKKCLARSPEDVVTRAKEGTCTVDNFVITKTQGLFVVIVKRKCG